MPLPTPTPTPTPGTKGVLVAMETDRVRILGKQLQIFEERIAKCVKSYSEEKFHDNLVILKNTWAGKIRGKITSLQSLRSVLDERHRWSDERNRTPTYEEDQMVTYFTWYLEFIKYFRKLKQGFDDKIHKVLLQYVYDDTNNVTTSSDDDVKTDVDRKCITYRDDVNKCSHLWKAAGLEDKCIQLIRSIEDDYKEMAARDVMSQIDEVAEQILCTGRNLEDLLRDDADVSSLSTQDGHFTHDANSREETHRADLKDTQDIFLMAKLVPEILRMFNELSDNAREWYNLDQQTSSNFQNDFHKLKKMNRQVTSQLKDLENQIALLSVDLEDLDETMEKFDGMEAREKSLHTRLLGAKRELAQTRERRELADYERKDLVRTRARLTSDFGLDAGEVAVVENLQVENVQQVARLEREQRLHAYNIALIEDDIEMLTELHPDIIRFTQTAQEQRERKEEDVRILRASCRRLEEILGIIEADRHHVEAEILKHTMLRHKRDSITHNNHHSNHESLHKIQLKSA